MNKFNLPEAFKDAMKSLYPSGLDPVTNQEQWRALVRCFAMGYAVGASFAENVIINGAVRAWLVVIKDENWQPDEKWQWW